MSLLIVSIISVLSLFFTLLLSIILFVSLKKYKEKVTLLDIQVQSTSYLVNELEILNNKIQQQLDQLFMVSDKTSLENSQISKQLEHRIKTLQSQVVEQEQRINQWQDSQGQDKFYNRAFKLAGKGAGIEEIMSECELPRAEVEMLLSVYQQRSRTQ